MLFKEEIMMTVARQPTYHSRSSVTVYENRTLYFKFQFSNFSMGILERTKLKLDTFILHWLNNIFYYFYLADFTWKGNNPYSIIKLLLINSVSMDNRLSYVLTCTTEMNTYLCFKLIYINAQNNWFLCKNRLVLDRRYDYFMVDNITFLYTKSTLYQERGGSRKRLLNRVKWIWWYILHIAWQIFFSSNTILKMLTL